MSSLDTKPRVAKGPDFQENLEIWILQKYEISQHLHIYIFSMKCVSIKSTKIFKFFEQKCLCAASLCPVAQKSHF